jgi:hypothetical protein
MDLGTDLGVMLETKQSLPVGYVPVAAYGGSKK